MYTRKVLLTVLLSVSPYNFFGDCCTITKKGFYHVVIDKNFFGSGLHFVIVRVSNDDGQSRCSRHGWVATVLDDDGDLVLLLLLAIE